MKLTKHLFGVVLTAITAGALVSCTQEFSESGFNNDLSSIKLVKAPEVYAWSGEQTLSSSDVSTRGTDMNANMWNQTWDCPPRPAEDLTDVELAELKALLSKGVETHNKIVLPFENYYVQQIYKGEDTYTPTDINGDEVKGTSIKGSDKMDKLSAYGSYGYEDINNFNSGTNTNTPGNCGCGVSHSGTTLMTGMPTTGFGPEEQFGFHESFGTSHDYLNYIIVEYKGYYYVGFDYEMHKNEAQNANEAKNVERDWNFTDWIVRITPAYHKGQTPTDNPGGIISDNETPDNSICDKCKHPSHEEGDCDECDPGKDCHHAVCKKCGHDVVWDADLLMFVHVVESQKDPGNCGECESLENESQCTDGEIVALDDDKEIGDNTKPGSDTPSTKPSTPSTPSTPGYQNRHNREVEVNFELVDSHDKYKVADLVTKLSIHVRCATDVDIKIPVPSTYVIESDDLYIFNEHYGKFEGDEKAGYHGTYGGSKGGLLSEIQIVPYKIGNQTVTLTVEFIAPDPEAVDPFKNGYIHVYTTGITQEVIDWCMAHNGDGINFEVWTYYQTQSVEQPTDPEKTKRDVLKGYLNQSTIEFICEANDQEAPIYYINAFGYDYIDETWGHQNTGTINPDDCTVKPADDSVYEWKYTEAFHLNGTPYNDIYVKSGSNADETHSDGTPVGDQ